MVTYAAFLYLPEEDGIILDGYGLQDRARRNPEGYAALVTKLDAIIQRVFFNITTIYDIV